MWPEKRTNFPLLIIGIALPCVAVGMAVQRFAGVDHHQKPLAVEKPAVSPAARERAVNFNLTTNLVSQRLLAPISAVFPDADFGLMTLGGRRVASGVVHSQNSGGAMVRERFEVDMDQVERLGVGAVKFWSEGNPNGKPGEQIWR